MRLCGPMSSFDVAQAFLPAVSQTFLSASGSSCSEALPFEGSHVALSFGTAGIPEGWNIYSNSPNLQSKARRAGIKPDRNWQRLGGCGNTLQIASMRRAGKP